MVRIAPERGAAGLIPLSAMAPLKILTGELTRVLKVVGNRESPVAGEEYPVPTIISVKRQSV